MTRLLGVPAGALIKAFPLLIEGRGPLVVVRGDHRLNEIKLQNALGAPARAAESAEVRDVFGAEPGFIGPVGARVEVIADDALRELRGLVAGASDPISTFAAWNLGATSSRPGRTCAASSRATAVPPARRSAWSPR